MSDQTPIEPPAGAAPGPVNGPPAGYAAAPAYAAAPTPRKRLLWPFLLSGGALLVIVLIIIGGVLAYGSIIAAQAEEREAADLENAEQTVVDFDQAYEDADCDDYEAVTDDNFRDDYSQELYGENYDCDTWSDGAGNLTVDGDYIYSVKITDVDVDGDDAEVATREQAKGEDKIDFTYTLERADDNNWVIVSYESD